MLNNMKPRHSLYTRYLKRPLDAIGAAVALVVLFPVMTAVAIAIAATMGRPVMFRQQRIGRDEKTFEVFKFRTMSEARGKTGKLLTDSQRLTSLGRLLRSTSLDELPQLWNILRGDMSFIGPRPLLTSYLPYYTNRERLRHTVTPGVTGLAQVNGRNEIEWDTRLAYDVEYVEHMSLWADVRIALKTIAKVLSRSDVRVVTDAQWFGPLHEYRSGRQRREAA
jgi:undecaprenyl phosphate N,N'-diacetylbacillosamine 1-phosphate transferase